MVTDVIVTATVSRAVWISNSARRSVGMIKAAPLPNTWKSKLTGGITVGRRATAAAAHQPP
jgi:hypothetical protein